MIKSSLDWSRQERDRLKEQIHALPYNADLRKMLNNIDGMITDLSRKEVELRRVHRKNENFEELEKVNDAIRTLEQWIMMAALIK